jgi:phage terminase large subunit GpA-like protein
MNKTFVCKHCRKPFERKVIPSKAKQSTYEFCSPSCRNKARALKQIPCPVCGNMFTPQVNDTGGARKRHCSTKCGNASRRGSKSTNPLTHSEQERVFIKKHYPSKGADWIVSKLGHTKKAISALTYKLGVVLNKEVYRSKVHGAAKKNMTGSTNPNWQGGITYAEWGSNWIEQRAKARKRDGYKCQVCGYWSRSIHVHHIKPRRLFDGHVEDANVLSNLISLCGSHHILVEMGKIPCPKPISD